MFINEMPVAERYDGIDSVLRRYLEIHPTFANRWLLSQTIHTGQQRRALLPILQLKQNARVLDIGAGFGAMTFDLAATYPASITGIDLDVDTIKIARDLKTEILHNNLLVNNASVEFVEGNVDDLPFETGTFDFVIARFVYQHLAHPERATEEIARVLKVGGDVCLIDIDEQFAITYPERSGGFERLQAGFSELQKTKGGDREVGRKLATYLHEGGLSVLGTVIQPQAQFMKVDDNDSGFTHTVDQFLQLREEFIEHGIMSGLEFDKCLASYHLDAHSWQFHANATLLVFARKTK